MNRRARIALLEGQFRQAISGAAESNAAIFAENNTDRPDLIEAYSQGARDAAESAAFMLIDFFEVGADAAAGRGARHGAAQGGAMKGRTNALRNAELCSAFNEYKARKPDATNSEVYRTIGRLRGMKPDTIKAAIAKHKKAGK